MACRLKRDIAMFLSHVRFGSNRVVFTVGKLLPVYPQLRICRCTAQTDAMGHNATSRKGQLLAQNIYAWATHAGIIDNRRSPTNSYWRGPRRQMTRVRSASAKIAA